MTKRIARALLLSVALTTLLIGQGRRTSAQAGAGTNVTKSLHRIEESALRKEVEAAGFRLAATGDFLRNPDDPRSLPVSKNTVPNDEFVLKFVKP